MNHRTFFEAKMHKVGPLPVMSKITTPFIGGYNHLATIRCPPCNNHDSFQQTPPQALGWVLLMSGMKVQTHLFNLTLVSWWII